jgi:hypothetical protein
MITPTLKNTNRNGVYLFVISHVDLSRRHSTNTLCIRCFSRKFLKHFSIESFILRGWMFDKNIQHSVASRCGVWTVRRSGVAVE